MATIAELTNQATVSNTDKFEVHGDKHVLFSAMMNGQTLVNPTLTNPTMTTPTLGVASATTVNKVAVTAPATGATLTLIDGTVLTGPSASGTCATLAGSETLTNKQLTSPVLVTPSIGVASGTSLAVSGLLTSSSPSAGIGYANGAGGSVTQITSRTTGVTVNALCGAITLVSAAGTASWQTFTVTNSSVAATDVVQVCQKSGTDKNMIHVTAVAAGSFAVTFATTGGTTTETPVFNFIVHKAVAS